MFTKVYYNKFLVSSEFNHGCGGGDNHLNKNKWAWVITIRGMFQLTNVDKQNVGGSASFRKLNGNGKLEIIKPEEIEEIL